MKRSPLALVARAASLVALIALAGCGGKGGEEKIVIGEYGSITGTDATFGGSTRDGVAVAWDELAASGGKIGGLNVAAITPEDDEGKAEEAATAVQKIVNQDQAVAVIGEVASSRSLAAAPICQNAGVPMISPSSTNPKVTQAGDYIFRVCFLDDFQGWVMANFTANNLKLKKVAILWDVKSDYSKGLKDYFATAFKGMGGTIVGDQSYSSGDQDFRAQLTALKAKNPQAIFVPGYYTEAGLIARQARETGFKGPLLGGDGWESSKLIEIGGDAMNGCYYSNHWALDAPDSNLQHFVAEYKKKFNGSEPDAIAGLAYDATRILFAAMNKLATDDPKTFAGLSSKNAGTDLRKQATAKLRDEIAQTKDYPGATGKITIDPNRNASKPAVVIEIKDGKKMFNTTTYPQNTAS
ncbi:MAG TPA: ABC transporter substrate-binding protein [Candidatus Eisenbacteria bacterium]|jgi:branched-chain amino acid transport system substrate-binding protein|nr:ABC transporter substrate-binding protein [Candidatus Eisenbacteria bacterium]